MKQALIVVLGLAAILVVTLAVFGLPVFDSLRLIADGAFGDKFGIARTLVKCSPLLLCGLGMLVAWRAGMYNIGGEGQYIVGALCAAWLYKSASGLPPALLSLLMVISCAAGGAAYAWLAGWLHVKRGVQVVISTILLNFIALQMLPWAVQGPLQEGKRQLPQSDKLPELAMFMRFDRQTDLHVGVFMGLIAVVLIQIYLFRTASGFQLRLTGENPNAARAAKVDSGKVQIRAMMISGALCGLAAASEYVGVTGVLDKGFSQNWGFMGIPVALVGGLHPLGVFGAAAYFGALFAGSENLARFSSSGTTLIYVMQAMAVLAVVGLWSLSKRKVQAGDVE